MWVVYCTANHDQHTSSSGLSGFFFIWTNKKRLYVERWNRKPNGEEISVQAKMSTKRRDVEMWTNDCELNNKIVGIINKNIGLQKTRVSVIHYRYLRKEKLRWLINFKIKTIKLCLNENRNFYWNN